MRGARRSFPAETGPLLVQGGTRGGSGPFQGSKGGARLGDTEAVKPPHVGWEGKGKVGGGCCESAHSPYSRGGARLAPRGVLISRIFSCKNHKALTAVMPRVVSALVRRGAGPAEPPASGSACVRLCWLWNAPGAGEAGGGASLSSAAGSHLQSGKGASAGLPITTAPGSAGAPSRALWDLLATLFRSKSLRHGDELTSIVELVGRLCPRQGPAVTGPCRGAAWAVPFVQGREPHGPCPRAWYCHGAGGLTASGQGRGARGLPGVVDLSREGGKGPKQGRISTAYKARGVRGGGECCSRASSRLGLPIPLPSLPVWVWAAEQRVWPVSALCRGSAGRAGCPVVLPSVEGEQ